MDQISITPAQLLALHDALEKHALASKDSVNYRRAQNCGNCSMFRSMDSHGEGDHGTCTLVEGEIHRYDVCDKWNAGDTYHLNKPYAGKSEETPSLMATPDLLGTEGLWHTPDRHVPTKQKLPNYIEHIADALMRSGHSEQEAIAFAVNAVKRWSRGELGWGKKKVTPTVQAAAKKTLEEWEKLKASHHGPAKKR